MSSENDVTFHKKIIIIKVRASRLDIALNRLYLLDYEKGKGKGGSIVTSQVKVWGGGNDDDDDDDNGK